MSQLIQALQVEKFRKAQKNSVFIDATWNGANGVEAAKSVFLEKRLATARFMNLEDFVDRNAGLPNTVLKDPVRVSEALTKLGITKESKIVLYDNSTCHSSCRAWWLLKYYGHPPELLFIFDGGISAWEKFGGKFDSGEERVNAAKEPYPVNIQSHLLRTLDEMKSNVQHPREQVLDVRHPVRFMGGGEERSDLRTGHIPGSFSFPYQAMFQTDGLWKSLELIEKKIFGIGVDYRAPIITTCGSGMTAPILNFALDALGHTQNAMYDGSWSEWGKSTLFEGETSLDERPVRRSID